MKVDRFMSTFICYNLIINEGGQNSDIKNKGRQVKKYEIKGE